MIDESTQEWIIKYTCPAWMCVVRKPHPFGNEMHTIACGLSTIMRFAEKVEGRDRPCELRRNELGEIGKKVGKCCVVQGLFGTVQRWLLWIVAYVLQRVICWLLALYGLL